jgi:hypothetical protein
VPFAPGASNDVIARVFAQRLGELWGQSGLKRTAADAGAVALIQRFGSAANLNVHRHCLVLDGVSRRTEGGPSSMRRAPPPAMHPRACSSRASRG